MNGGMSTFPPNVFKSLSFVLIMNGGMSTFPPNVFKSVSFVLIMNGGMSEKVLFACLSLNPSYLLSLLNAITIYLIT